MINLAHACSGFNCCRPDQALAYYSLNDGVIRETRTRTENADVADLNGGSRFGRPCGQPTKQGRRRVLACLFARVILRRPLADWLLLQFSNLFDEPVKLFKTFLS